MGQKKGWGRRDRDEGCGANGNDNRNDGEDEWVTRRNGKRMDRMKDEGQEMGRMGKMSESGMGRGWTEGKWK